MGASTCIRGEHQLLDTTGKKIQLSRVLSPYIQAFNFVFDLVLVVTILLG